MQSSWTDSIALVPLVFAELETFLGSRQVSELHVHCRACVGTQDVQLYILAIYVSMNDCSQLET